MESEPHIVSKLFWIPVLPLAEPPPYRAKIHWVDIIDPQIIDEEGEAVDEVAALAVKCTKLNGEDRPTMREVEMTLENLKGTKKQVHNTTSRRKYEKDHYMPFGELTLDTSRQYTMEEEILLSARYPR